MTRIAIVGFALLAACSMYDESMMPMNRGADASGGAGGSSVAGRGGKDGGTAKGGGAGIGGDTGSDSGAGTGGDTATDSGAGTDHGAAGTGGGGAAGRDGAAPPTPRDAAADASTVSDASEGGVVDSSPPPAADTATPTSDAGDAASRPPDGGDAGPVGCTGTTLLPSPDDPSLRGPWAVGVRTVTIGRLATEIFYPAALGSEQGKAEATYDVRAWLPARERNKVPDANSPAVKPIGGNLFRDLPLDTDHGPYPVVIHVHGTASFRIASASTMTQWASRGFVVVAADYPGMFLADMLAGTLDCRLPTSGLQDVPGDITTQVQALTMASGNLAFLANHLDMTRLGLSGHSHGACITATLNTNANVQIMLSMAGSAPTQASAWLRALMYLGGIDDKVVGYDAPLLGNAVCQLFSSSTTGAFEASPGPPDVTKRLVGVTGGGHLVMTDLCQKNAVGRNAIEEAQADGVCGINSAVIIGLPALFDCGTIDMATGIKAVDYATTAALEEALMCKDRSMQFATLKANVPSIGDFQEAK